MGLRSENSKLVGVGVERRMHSQESFNGVALFKTSLSRIMEKVLYPRGAKSEPSPFKTPYIPFRMSKSLWHLSSATPHCLGQGHLETQAHRSSWLLTDSLEVSFSKRRQMAQGCAYFTWVKLKHSFGGLSGDKNQLHDLLQSWQTWSYLQQ